MHTFCFRIVFTCHYIMWGGGLDQDIMTGFKLVKISGFPEPGLHILSHHQNYNFQTVWASKSSTGISRSATSLVKVKYHGKRRQPERQGNNFSCLSYHNVIKNRNGNNAVRNYPTQRGFREMRKTFGCCRKESKVGLKTPAASLVEQSKGCGFCCICVSGVWFSDGK